jgi:hypothetical protein
MFVHATLFEINARALDDIGDDLLVYGSDLVIRHLDDSCFDAADVKLWLCFVEGWIATLDLEARSTSRATMTSILAGRSKDSFHY